MANTSKPVSFHPLTLEQAVSGLLKVKPPAKVQAKPKRKARNPVQKMDYKPNR